MNLQLHSVFLYFFIIITLLKLFRLYDIKPKQDNDSFEFCGNSIIVIYIA